MKKIFISIIMISIIIVALSKVNAVQMSNIGKSGEFVKVTSAPTINEQIKPDSSFNDIISSIYGIAAYICYGAGLAVILVKGVKFMNAAPDAKAEIKKQAIAIVVGATILFGIGVFLQIIANITAESLF